MSEQQQITDYDRIARAIDFLRLNFKRQPALDEVAEQVCLSSFHFQRMFKEWAGVSPKKFLQYLTIEHAKLILKDNNHNLLDATFRTGLSGTSRLHDLFITIEGMTPGEYRKGGENLSINYTITGSCFGKLIIASTYKGICHLAFCEEDEPALQKLKEKFPNAVFSQQADAIQQKALAFFNRDWTDLKQIKLHLKGTSFQLKVWETLLRIPMGKLTTYSTVAATVGNPGASRAAGSAVGQNPVAFLIPCHRVIRSTGDFGQYHWGGIRKSAIIGWEAAGEE